MSQQQKRVYASVYYYKNLDPRDSKELHDLWFAMRKTETTTITLDKSLFDKNWAFVSRASSTKKNTRDVLEDIFRTYNIDGLNPLATPEGQARIRTKGARHTSMSMGDIVFLDGKYWMVASFGFKKVVWRKE